MVNDDVLCVIWRTNYTQTKFTLFCVENLLLFKRMKVQDRLYGICLYSS